MRPAAAGLDWDKEEAEEGEGGEAAGDDGEVEGERGEATVVDEAEEAEEEVEDVDEEKEEEEEAEEGVELEAKAKAFFKAEREVRRPAAAVEAAVEVVSFLLVEDEGGQATASNGIWGSRATSKGAARRRAEGRETEKDDDGRKGLGLLPFMGSDFSTHFCAAPSPVSRSLFFFPFPSPAVRLSLFSPARACCCRSCGRPAQLTSRRERGTWSRLVRSVHGTTP